MQVLENIPDSAKLAVSTVPPGLYFFGVPVEHWILILSAIASIMVIIEKIPKTLDAIHKIRQRFKRKNVKME